MMVHKEDAAIAGAAMGGSGGFYVVADGTFVGPGGLEI